MLNLIFFLLSGAGAASLCATSEGLSFWWLPLFWIGFYLAITLVFFLGFVISIPFISRNPNPEKPDRFSMKYLHFMTNWLFGFLWVRIKREGFEKLPKTPFVLVANHISNFDPMVVMAAYPGAILFISKESNFKIPFIGSLIRKAGYLSIDRENGMRALRTLKSAADLVQNEGLSIGIYPEGTRSRSGKLQEFKDGAFYLAKKAGVPVVVMASHNTEKIRMGKHFLPITVTLKVLDVWQPEELAATPLPELAQKSHDLILAELHETD
ncbi:MAG: 1-acyl-sn-glycerol-3-phosphate acyltransferase [Clostridia bacterium]|nr:1-acyl-sn-glycerol-3-phosphate acyltransferase [Clostridia bacterium]